MSRSYNKVVKDAIPLLRPRDSKNKGENLPKPRFTKVGRGERVWTHCKDRTIVQGHRQTHIQRESEREAERKERTSRMRESMREVTGPDIPSPGMDAMLFRSQLLCSRRTHNDVPTRRLDSIKATVKAPKPWAHIRHWL